MKQDTIAVIDFSTKKSSELARHIRSLGVYSEIHPYDKSFDDLKKIEGLKGIVFYSENKNDEIDEKILNNFNCLLINFDNYSDKICGTENDIENFIFNICKCEKSWSVENFINKQVAQIKKQVGNEKVLLGLSGGVDSSVVAALLIKAIGKNVVCVHVNNGLLRKNEAEHVVEVFGKELDATLIYVDATERFLTKLKGVSDPEAKRKVIGTEFIRVFEEEARKLDGIKFLAQGTIYPDIVESGSKNKKGIKSHHNVGGLPSDMKFELVEPLKYLFKDEVRVLGKALGLPDDMVFRPPFPGPGLGVRCLGEITLERLEAVRESDAILTEELTKAGLADKIWQYFTAVPNFKSVGVKNGVRSYAYPVIVRAVNTVDAMTATIERLDWDLLDRITHRITHEIENVNRVVYDLTPKPLGTIEWE
ncbi:MAG TPA: glutamine-hydrolyzing GMP synthase [Clostridiales bacterium]|nr:glutamine-hydrolyzing GMP synthase [Clostridiales bacterium]